MVDATYQVVHADPRTGYIRSVLPVSSISYTDTLNEAGSASFTLPLYALEADSRDLSPFASALAILRDGEPVWGGLLWTATADLSAQSLTLSASGWHSYYKGVPFVNGFTATADQGTLLADWIDSANRAGGIATDTSYITTTGRRRSRQWTRYEFKTVGEAIEELADEDGGFSFRYRTVWLDRGTRIGHQFLKYSTGGALDPWSLIHGVDCNVTQVAYDGSQIATHTHAVGADPGNGENLLGHGINESLLAGVPTKHVVQSFNDVKNTPTLFEKSAALVTIGRSPIAIPSLTLYPGVYDPTVFTPGDAGRVEASAGYVLLADDFVVTERKVDVNQSGSESTTLSLANKEVFHFDEN